MEIQIYKVATKWAFRIVAKNKVEVASSLRMYASQRNAKTAAKLIAKSKLKVVVQ